MKYLLFMYPDPETFPDTAATYDNCVELCADLVGGLIAKGQFLGAGILEPPELAKNIRIREGARLITDGPFVETREQFAGYLLIEAESLDEAVAVAMRHPVVHAGAIDIRPVKEVSFEGALTAAGKK